jgi:hypothetical protein
MSLVVPTLEGTSLPPPSGYEESDSFRGASVVMSSGVVKFEIVQSSAKIDFTLTWDALTETQIGTIRTAWAAIKTTYTSSNFLSLRNVSYTVTRHPDQKELKFPAVKTARGIRFKGQIKLREV